MYLVVFMQYPNGIKKDYTKIKTYSNRGMTLESELNTNNIAVIHKKPTPVTINKVDYKSRCDATITEAHFKIPSTTDYNGIYKNRYIDFEAKETKKDFFPLANIHAHQIEHLKKINEHGGIGFIIVRFTNINETYYLSIEKLLKFIQTNKKSIPLNYFKENGYIIKQGYIPLIDYLKIVEKEFL